MNNDNITRVQRADPAGTVRAGGIRRLFPQDDPAQRDGQTGQTPQQRRVELRMGYKGW